MLIIVIGSLLVFALVIGAGLSQFAGSGGPAPTTATLSKVMVTIDDEELTARDLDNIKYEENFVARALAMAIDRTVKQGGSPVPPAAGVPAIQINPPNLQQQFPGGAYAYPVTDTTALQMHLFRKKGKEIGITISDQDVDDFLMKSTGGAITPLEYVDGPGYQGILSTLQGGPGGVSYNEFFEMVRNTLVAQKTAILLMSSNLVVTPESAWSSFRDLNRTVSTELLPVFTKDYLEDVPEPKDADLRELFHKYYSLPGNPNQNQIGFRQQDKIAVAYFKAEYDTFLETEKNKVTPEQIQEYYKENKDSFRKAQLPPETDPGAVEEKATDSTSEEESETSGTDNKVEPADGTEESATSEKEESAEEKPDATTEPATPEKVEEADKKESPAEGDSSSFTPSIEAFQVALLQDEEEKTEEKTEDADTKKEEATTTEAAASPEAPVVEPPVIEYKPIDEVEDEIRNAIARPTAQENLDKALKTVRDTLGSTYETNKKDRYDAERNTNPNFQPYAGLDLKTLAEENGLQYAEMPLSDFNQARENEGIGQISHTEYIRDPVRGFAPSTRQLVVQVFSSSAPLFKASMFPGAANPNAFSLGSPPVQFVYWKTGEADGYLPEYDESKEAVTAVWNQREAAKLAKAAAEKLAEKAKTVEYLKELSEDAEKVIIAENVTYFDEMSMQQGQPQFGSVPGVEDIGLDFMSAIFATPVGSVAVAPNGIDSVFYVVRVTSEQKTTEELRDSLVKQTVNDLPPQVRGLGGDRYGLGQRMAVELLDEYDTVWVENPRTESGF